jgi:hypothetical protein
MMASSEVPDLHRTTIYLTPKQYAWLRRKAFVETVTIAAIIRQIVESARSLDEPEDGRPLRKGAR